MKLLAASAIAFQASAGISDVAQKDSGAVESNRYGDTIALLPASITQVLAQHYRSNGKGAMGRNQPGYFHVRFQMGLHHLAHHAIAAQSAIALTQFVSALKYAFDHQTRDGNFELIIPPELSEQGQPSSPDLASGVAFFMSSAGSGLLAIQTSVWADKTIDLKPLLERLSVIEKRLAPTLQYLFEQRHLLEAADQRAPNRLLINATALMTLGQLLRDVEACNEARRLIAIATNQIHADGYFIEGGGYDSSYNGVATATLLRLAIMENSAQLQGIALRALDWQLTRISDHGEILTDGNTRVHANGEAFLGRPKDVDVAHTLEALALASVDRADRRYINIAEQVYRYYQ